MRTLLTLTLVALLTLCGGCKKDQTLQAIAQIVAPILISQAQDMINDPDWRADIGQPSANIADLAIAWLWPRIQNEINSWAYSTDPADLKAYKLYRKANPDVEVMVAGLWPGLEAQLSTRGYLPTATKRLKIGPIKFTADDYNAMLPIETAAIIQVYRDTKGVEPEPEPGIE